MPTYPKGLPADRPAFAVVPGSVMHTASERVGIVTGDLTLNNIVPLVKLPRGAIVHDVVIKVTDMDSGSAGIVSVGVPGDTERYIRRVSIQAAGTFRAGNDTTATGTMLAAAPLAADTVVGMLVQTAPGTALAGTVDICVAYSME
jgi:hypothetical protein